MKSKDESGAAAVLLLVARWTTLTLAAVFSAAALSVPPFSEPVSLRPLLQTGTTGPVTVIF